MTELNLWQESTDNTIYASFVQNVLIAQSLHFNDIYWQQNLFSGIDNFLEEETDRKKIISHSFYICHTLTAKRHEVIRITNTNDDEVTYNGKVIKTKLEFLNILLDRIKNTLDEGTIKVLLREAEDKKLHEEINHEKLNVTQVLTDRIAFLQNQYPTLKFGIHESKSKQPKYTQYSLTIKHPNINTYDFFALSVQSPLDGRYNPTISGGGDYSYTITTDSELARLFMIIMNRSQVKNVMKKLASGKL